MARPLWDIGEETLLLECPIDIAATRHTVISLSDHIPLADAMQLGLVQEADW
jgi:hypothetical protein